MNRPRVSSVSGSGQHHVLGLDREVRRGRRRRNGRPAANPRAAVRPTTVTSIPAARSRRTVSRPTGPGPTTRTFRPSRGSVSRCSQVRACCSSIVRRRSLVNISSTPSTHSAMGRSHTPRELLTTMSPFTISSVSKVSTPMLEVWIHRSSPGPDLAQQVGPKVVQEQDFGPWQRSPELVGRSNDDDVDFRFQPLHGRHRAGPVERSRLLSVVAYFLLSGPPRCEGLSIWWIVWRRALPAALPATHQTVGQSLRFLIGQDPAGSRSRNPHRP